MILTHITDFNVTSAHAFSCLDITPTILAKSEKKFQEGLEKIRERYESFSTKMKFLKIQHGRSKKDSKKFGAFF